MSSPLQRISPSLSPEVTSVQLLSLINCLNSFNSDRHLEVFMQIVDVFFEEFIFYSSLLSDKFVEFLCENFLTILLFSTI